MTSFFVCGTDTGVGKTVITGLLAKTFLEEGYSVITQKWVQTGSKGFPQDIATHLKLMGKTKKYVKGLMDLVCPYTFKFPSSPHLAAKLEGKKVEVRKIKDAYNKLCDMFDIVIVEGVGGALVPFNEKNLLLDVVKELKIPVILVVGNKLGAINHALLTAEAIKNRGLKIAGAVFNETERSDKKISRDNIRIITKHLGIMGYVSVPNLKRYRRFMDFIDLVQARQSCRGFSSKPVPKDIVDKCLEAARLAPSACNSQPWKFIVVSSPEMRGKVSEAAFSGKYSMNAFAKKAPVIVLVARDKDKLIPAVGGFMMGTQFALVDIGIAAEHLVLAAAEQGIGTCYLGIFDEKKIKNVLKLPRNLKIDLVIPMGYPEDDMIRAKSRKPLEEIASII